MEKKIQAIALFFALIGVILTYAFAPEQKYAEFERCEGLVKARGTLIKTSFSSKGNYVGVLKTKSEALMVLIDYEFNRGDNVTVYARSSNFSGQCWLFPDMVVRDD